MEVQMFWYYLLAKLDDFNCFLAIFGYAGLVLTAAICIIFCAISDISTYNHEDFVVTFKRYIRVCKIKTLITLETIAIILSTLLPTTKQAAFIWIAPQIVENGAVKDTVKNIPELTKLGTEYLKELLKEKVNEHD